MHVGIAVNQVSKRIQLACLNSIPTPEQYLSTRSPDATRPLPAIISGVFCSFRGKQDGTVSMVPLVGEAAAQEVNVTEEAVPVSLIT
jgi:hypothetical protein